MYNDKDSLLPTLPKQKSNELLNFSISQYQFLLILVILLTEITPGMSIGFSAIALPQLQLSLAESSWFASIPTLGSIISNLAIGFLIDGYGRKVAFLVNTVSAFIGCIFLAGPATALNLYVGQFFLGCCQGAVTVPPSVYIAESIVPDNLNFRNSITSWNILAINTGIFLVYLFGCLFHYTYVALIGALFSLVGTILIVIFIPESPAWLDQKGRCKEAEISRQKLGFTENYTKRNHSTYQSIDNEENGEIFFSYILKIRRKDVYKPLLICVGYYFFQQFSGSQVFTAYMVQIINVKYVDVNPYFTTVIAGALIILSQFVYAFSLPSIGIRRMAILSSLGSGLMALLLAVCLYLEQTEDWYSFIVDYMHILSVWLFFFMGALGMTTIPYIIPAEIFPFDAKGIASIPIFSASIFYFIVLMIYPYAVAAYYNGIYFVFSIVSFLSIIFLYYCMPETVGKTLDEISNGFLH